MRRLLLWGAAAAAIVIAVTVLISRRSPDTYRVAAVFDTAKGVVPGQQVKIAGAVVGKVEAVDLVAGPKARLTLAIDHRFRPFHADASCQLLPEGIVSENFVACQPGSRGAPRLPTPGGSPTVPLRQTSVPTSLQDLLDVFAAPTPDRLRVLISELGIATSGRGDDLNALLRRANPALTQSTRLLETINSQRASLDAGVVQTDRIVAALARRHGDLQRFVSRAADVATTTAAHGGALSESVRRLPALLDASRPALHSLDHAMATGTPLLRSLQLAAPVLAETTTKVPPFASAAGDALRRLRPVADTGRRTVDVGRPLIAHLSTAAAKAGPFLQQTDVLLRDVRDGGGIEGILRWLYGLSSVGSGYDSTSHFATGLLRYMPQCVASAEAAGCSNKYDAPGEGTIPPDDPACGAHGGAPWDPPTDCTPQAPTRRRTHLRRAHLHRPAARRRPSPAPLTPGAPAAPPGHGPHAPPVKVPQLPPVKVPQLPPVNVPRAPDLPPAPSRSLDSATSLLDFLLGP